MNTNLKKLALVIGAAGAMAMADGAWADTDSANLTVGATVENACAIGAGTLDFGTLTLHVNAGLGTVTQGNHDADSGTSISIACTNGASATIGAGLGAQPAGSVRQMISGSDLLAYELYTSSAYTTVLDGASGVIAYTGTGAATTNKAIYGRITGAQLAAAKKGTYADTVAMTITYTP
ncbi:spore coat U domain-containing protein [Variovorax sp. J22R133]|uniref:Csu type fimbrial protein n=1 Tax=Variovorax brevis TaxID=3053503 RepID=UPI0025776C7D|nr:spore coat U domain-containing protein [Variovorax sp. J22R133]MDM0117584.1 spore coat U domain-containing protein [Variovorax sp. J22R133]